MPARFFVSRVAAIAAGCALCAASVSSQQAPVQQRPQFRSATTLVPVDVRVLDQRGRPITDLTAADFTILEDGVPQTISHFSSHALVAAEPDPEAPQLLRNPRATPVEPQNHRVFLLLLGRGRLQPPARGVDAALAFVRNSLLPQDHVAVLAWGRATDFTTDHASVVAVLERFKDAHEEIEALMAHHFSGLQAVYGSPRIPDFIQTRIDAVFETETGSPARALPRVSSGEARRIATAQREMIDLLQGTAGLDVFGAAAAADLDLTLDEFMAGATETNQDLGNVYAGIEYLRHIQGEKHLVHFSPFGPRLKHQESAEAIASVASDARVVIDAVLTGGIRPAVMRGGTLAGGPSGLSLPGMSGHFGGMQDTRALARLTGGTWSGFDWARNGMDRIAETTRFTYLLGYYPTNADWNGRQRRISVRVNRRGATVLYRHTYFANHELPPLDRREFVTYRRITSAGNYDEPIPDISIDVKASVQTGTDPAVEVNMRIAADRLSLVDEAGVRVGQLKIAVYVGDEDEQVIGETLQDMKLSLLPETYQRALNEGLQHTLRIPVTGDPVHVKAIVYDFAADLLGSAMVRLR